MTGQREEKINKEVTQFMYIVACAAKGGGNNIPKEVSWNLLVLCPSLSERGVNK